MKLVTATISLCVAASCGGDPVRHTPDAMGSTTDAAVDASGSVGSGYGLIWLTQHTQPTASSSMLVAFYQHISSPPTSMDGPCIYTHLIGNQPPEDNGGDIMVTGGSSTVTAASAPSGTYTPPSLPAQLFSGGETITAHVAGATVPAFAVTATAPALATLTQPAAFANVPVDPTMPLALAWTGGGTQDVTFVAYSGGTQAQLYCRFPAAPGSAEVPVAALARLASPGNASFAIFSNGHATAASSWGTTELSLIMPAVQNGAEVLGNLAVQ